MNVPAANILITIVRDDDRRTKLRAADFASIVDRARSCNEIRFRFRRRRLGALSAAVFDRVTRRNSETDYDVTVYARFIYKNEIRAPTRDNDER